MSKPLPRVLLANLPPRVLAPVLRSLYERGFTCETARTLGEAVYRAVENPPAAVLVYSPHPEVVVAVTEALEEEGVYAAVARVGDDENACAASALASVGLAAPVPEAAVRRPSILVVDDDPDVRALLEEHLVRCGFEVSLAVDGMDALAQVHARSPDIVLLDLMMPRLSGCGFLTRLAESERRPCVIVHSALPISRVMHMDRSVVSAIVRKPATLGGIIDAIRTSLSSPIPVHP